MLLGVLPVFGEDPRTDVAAQSLLYLRFHGLRYPFGLHGSCTHGTNKLTQTYIYTTPVYSKIKLAEDMSENHI